MNGKTVLQLIAEYREMLRAIGGMDNDLASVPAVGVRALLDAIEAAAIAKATGGDDLDDAIDDAGGRFTI